MIKYYDSKAEILTPKQKKDLLYSSADFFAKVKLLKQKTTEDFLQNCFLMVYKMLPIDVNNKKKITCRPTPIH